MKKVKKNVLAFARETGGAAAIEPVCRAILREGWDLSLLSKDNGLVFFAAANLGCTRLSRFDAGSLCELVNKRFGSLPDLIFTSAASLPALDMTEKYLWRWGRKNNITTVGLLDQWQNYALRFSGPGKDERLAYLPDYIFTMDDLSKQEMIRSDIPEERIVVTGQPAFDKIIEKGTNFSRKAHEARKKLGIPSDSTVVVFAAESLKKDFGQSLGYDEQSTCEFLGSILNEISERNKSLDMRLLIKLHPENRREEFNWALSRWPGLKKQIIKDELDSCEAIAISDLIVGMSSIFLVETILTGKIAVSLQINARVDSQLVATKVGAVPFIKTADEAGHTLKSLLGDSTYRKKYLHQQKTWKVNGSAAGRCLAMLKTVIKKNEENRSSFKKCSNMR